MKYRGRIDKYGRVIIPAKLRKTLDLHPGDTVIMDAGDDSLHMYSLKQAITAIQAEVRQFVPDDVSLVDDLVAMRRQEVENE